jgi:hypothetical protein
MNSFYEHHKGSIRWHYRCFDGILLNGLIQPFQQPERVVGFFNTYRQLYPVSRNTLRGIADQFQHHARYHQARSSRAENFHLSFPMPKLGCDNGPRFGSLPRVGGPACSITPPTLVT